MLRHFNSIVSHHHAACTLLLIYKLGQLAAWCEDIHSALWADRPRSAKDVTCSSGLIINRRSTRNVHLAAVMRNNDERPCSIRARTNLPGCEVA